MRDGEDPRLVLRQEDSREAEGQPGDAAESQPDPQEAGQPAGAVDESGEREQPHSPKSLGGRVLQVMEPEQEHRQGILLRDAEDGEEPCPAHDAQSTQIDGAASEVERGGQNAAEEDNEDGEGWIHGCEQTIEGKGEEDEDEGGEEITRDAQTEELLMGSDVVGRGLRVSCDEELCGDVDQAYRAKDDQQKVPETGDSSWIANRGHIILLVALLGDTGWTTSTFHERPATIIGRRDVTGGWQGQVGAVWCVGWELG